MATEPPMPDREHVACSQCDQHITDPGPVAHCAACGWQEMRGAD